MTNISNVKPILKHELKGVHQVVVQKGNVTGKNIYALQQLQHGTDTVVLKAAKTGTVINFDKKYGPNLFLAGVRTKVNGKDGTAGGHTQTWEFAGLKKQNKWFVGVKPKLDRNDINLDDENKKRYWTTQIARVSFENKTYGLNTDFPRLSSLNQAGSNYDKSVAYPGTELRRVEAAVSPEYTWFMIASIDYAGTGHFGLYKLSDINTVLDGADNTSNKKTKGHVSIADVPCYGAFTIKNINKEKIGIGSIQGYDIDEAKNVYISSELAPHGGSAISNTRKIVKIPWDASDQSQWEVIDLDVSNHDNNDGATLDVAGYATEFESVQVISTNHLYLTVSYHKVNSGTTLFSRIYEISWQS